MSYISSRSFSVMLVVAIAASIGFNLVQKFEVDRLKVLQAVSLKADDFVNTGYNELMLKTMNNLRDQNLEIVKNQGKIEGVLSVIQNYKPDTNMSSAIWHQGYYRGLDQSKYMAEMSTDNTPAYQTSFSETEDK